ncbi:MAG TPA: hypothetical protein VNF00_01885 [Candidatus Acidoferrales bacterium]|nr:hypothetical protein [Candidatus Acidoferrales bacterium]
MRKGIWLVAVAVLFATPHRAAAQQPSQSSPSQAVAQTQSQSPRQPQEKPDPLVEAARKNRKAQKAAPKSSTVFTNDNIPTSPGAVSVVGNATSAGKSSASAGKASGQSTSAGKKDEAAWRKKFADARHKLQQDQTELSLMQRESNQLQLQYYPDPTKALMQSVDRSDIIKKEKAIADKQKQIDADQQAISNLEDALRKAGGDPGWARE